MSEAAFIAFLIASPFVLALIAAGCLAQALRKDAIVEVRKRAIVAATPFPAMLVFTVVLVGAIGPGVADNGPQTMGGLMIMGTMLFLAPLLVLAGYNLALCILKHSQ